jgi:small subunit ribosomal protein S9
MAEDEKRDTPQEPEGTESEEAAGAPEAEAPPEPQEEQPAEEQPAEEEPAEAVAPEEPAEGEAPAGEERERPKRRGKKDKEAKDEVIPGEHLEPDLVLEEERRAAEAGLEDVAGVEVEAPEGELEGEQPAEAAEEVEEPVAREPLDLAADARYTATGKRKSAVARVIVRPGGGSYNVNGRPLDEFFPRIRLQKIARQPLETAGYVSRLDVVATIRGGGVSAQAGALRHGIARALVEADPSLRVELKRRGFLTRDPRRKERKKAGLKKARKRPQFSKR